MSTATQSKIPVGQSNQKVINEECDPKGSGTCQACMRSGLPILLLRHTIVVDQMKGTDPKLNATVFDAPPSMGSYPTTTSKGIDKMSRQLRVLRTGFVYVYLEPYEGKGEPVMQCYEVTPNGYLRRRLDLHATPEGEPAELPKSCVDNDHDIAATFLYVDDTQYKKVWVAFAHDPWTPTVIERYEADFQNGKKVFNERFQCIDVEHLLYYSKTTGDEISKFYFYTAPEPGSNVIDLLAEKVLEYRENILTEAEIYTRFRFQPRAARLGKLRDAIHNYMAQYERKLRLGMPVLALNDPIGDVMEANFFRNTLCIEKNFWETEDMRVYRWRTSVEMSKIRDLEVENFAREQCEDINKSVRRDEWSSYRGPHGSGYQITTSDGKSRWVMPYDDVPPMSNEDFKAMPAKQQEARLAHVERQSNLMETERQKVLSGRYKENALFGPDRTRLQVIEERLEEFCNRQDKERFDKSYVGWHNLHVRVIQKISQTYINLIKLPLFYDIVTQNDYADYHKDKDVDTESGMKYALMIAHCLEGGPMDYAQYEPVKGGFNLAYQKKAFPDAEQITGQLWCILKTQASDEQGQVLANMREGNAKTREGLRQLYINAITARTPEFVKNWDEAMTKLEEMEQKYQQDYAGVLKNPAALAQRNNEYVQEQVSKYFEIFQKTYDGQKEIRNFLSALRGHTGDILFSADLKSATQIMNYVSPPPSMANIGHHRTSNILLLGSGNTVPVKVTVPMNQAAIPDVSKAVNRTLLRESRLQASLGNGTVDANLMNQGFVSNGLPPRNVDVSTVFGVAVNPQALPKEILEIRNEKEFLQRAMAYVQENPSKFDIKPFSEADFPNGKFSPDDFAERFFPKYSPADIDQATQAQQRQRAALAQAKLQLSVDVASLFMTLWTINTLREKLQNAIGRERELLMLEFNTNMLSLGGTLMSIMQQGITIKTGGIDQQILRVFSAKGVVGFLGASGGVLSAVTSAYSCYSMRVNRVDSQQNGELAIVSQYYDTAGTFYALAAVGGVAGVIAGSAAVAAICPIAAPIIAVGTIVLLLLAAYYDSKAKEAKRKCQEIWLQRCCFGKLEQPENQGEVQPFAAEHGQVLDAPSDTTPAEVWRNSFSFKWDSPHLMNMAFNYINAIWMNMNPSMMPYVELMKSTNFAATRDRGDRRFFVLSDASISLPDYEPTKSGFSFVAFAQLTKRDGASGNRSSVLLAKKDYNISSARGHRSVPMPSPVVLLTTRSADPNSHVGWLESSDKAPECRPDENIEPENTEPTVQHSIAANSISRGVVKYDVVWPTTSEQTGYGNYDSDKLVSDIKHAWTLDMDAASLMFMGIRLRYWRDASKPGDFVDFELHEALRFNPEGKCYFNAPIFG